MADPRETVEELLLSLQAAGIDYLPFRGEVREAAPRRPRPAEPLPAPILSTPPRIVLPPEAPKPSRAAAKPTVPKTVVPAPPTGRLELLAQDVSLCQRCASLAISRTRTVFGEGGVQPLVMFLGEAPSAEEDASGRLFVGPVGELFDKMLAACRLTRGEVYLTNLLKCRVPGKRSSKPEECENCRDYLDEQIDAVNPSALCCFGEIVGRRLLKVDSPIGELRAGTFEYRGRPVYCTHHPREILAQPKSPDGLRKAVWEDLKRMLAELGRPVG